MGFYDDKVLPHLINCACSSPPIMHYRRQVVPQCYGKVLEVGMGSGINLQYYQNEQVEFVWGLEPSDGMRKKAQKNLSNSPVEVHWLDLPGEKIPLEDNSVDSILLTFTLCTIPDWAAALKQMRRVLKPEGKLFFCEHGQADSQSISRWQERINPLWNKLAGGCNLNRDIPSLISQSGFAIKNLQTEYARKTPKIAGFIYRGEAYIDERNTNAV
jgi:ubiquinone/menaquinone biosynthesis C-methylase UbiE